MRLVLLGVVAAAFVAHGWVFAIAAEAASGSLPRTTMSDALMTRVGVLEARLLEAAADRDLVRLIDGVSGEPERRIAESTLESLRGDDGRIVADACITRLSDRTRTVLGGERPDSVCTSKAARRAVAAAPAGTVIQTLPVTGGGRQRLLLTTQLEVLPGEAASVIAADIDLDALMADVMPINADARVVMLVDLDSAAVLASAGVSSTDTSRDLEPYITGLIAGGSATWDAATEPGLGATVAPLWTTTSGRRTGLIEVVPIDAVPAEIVPIEAVPAEIVPIEALPADAAPIGAVPGEAAPDDAAPTPLSPAMAEADGRGILLPIAAGVLIIVPLLVGWTIWRARGAMTAGARIEALYREAQEGMGTDPLTGLGQGKAYEEGLGQLMETYLEHGLGFAVAHLDIDDLRVVNDREGQAAGDEMLTAVAETLQQLLRPEDTVFRTGGDEFAVLLPGLDARAAVPRLERALHFCRRPASGLRPSSFSAGVSGVPDYSTDADIVTHQAVTALAWVKAHGRGAAELYDPDRDRVADQPHDIANSAVHEVVTGKLLSPVFQPIVDVRTGRVLGFEGLIRPDPGGPLPSTSHLFAAASATGRTVELDLVCVELVLAGARDIGSDRLLTLNLSPRTLEMKDFDASWLLDGLLRNGISPGRVIVELTERDAISDLPRLRQALEHLQSYGLRLAADDVGAGNSGLRLLSQVQFDIVKIDLSLVQEGVHHTGSRAVLESLRNLATDQQAHVVAEGVETAEQLQVVQGLDIGAAQGYLLGRPNRSVEATYVDVRQLASGLVVPASASLPSDATDADAAAAAEQLPAHQNGARLGSVASPA